MLLPTVLLDRWINNIFKKYLEKLQYPTLCNFKQTTYSKFELKKERNSSWKDHKLRRTKKHQLIEVNLKIRHSNHIKHDPLA